jgi:hypothetical protein
MNSITDRYTVRYWTDTEKTDEGYSRVRHLGWWVYDWKEKKTVQTFPVSEQGQANAICKLMNSIEEEDDGLSK